MNNLLKVGFIIAASGIIFSQCKREEDKTVPVFEMQSLSPATVSDSICEEPADNVVPIMSGQNLVFQFKITDNEALGQYKIDIHDDFDCHGHEGERSPVPTIWSVQDVVNMSGKEQVVSRTLQVPADVMAGNYHFQLKAIDAEGNENRETPIYTLQIRNSSDTVEPNFSNLNTVATQISRGQTLTIAGTAADNLALENGKIELEYHNPSDIHATAQSYIFPTGAGVSASFSLSFQIPNDFATGMYEFELKLYDNVGNISEQHFEIQVQ